MNVTSFELSRELYELSTWDDTHSYYNDNFVECRDEALFDNAIPAYDLGYLLRKLPDGPFTFNHRGKAWVMAYLNNHVNGNSFEDCAALLCIELIKQNVIKIEDKA